MSISHHDHRPHEYGDGRRCTSCGKPIRRRLSGLHKAGICHLCRCRQLKSKNAAFYL